MTKTGKRGKAVVGDSKGNDTSAVNMLTGKELEDLKNAWRADANKKGCRSAFDRLAPLALGALDARAMAWINPIGDYFFEPDRVAFPTSAPIRERCIIAIAAATDPNGPMLLPLHVFWGLMEGLTPHEIADVIAVAGVYAGLQRYTDAMQSFVAVLGWIKDSIASGFQPPQRTRHPTAQERILTTIAIIKGTAPDPSWPPPPGPPPVKVAGRAKSAPRPRADGA
jgi:alkylhydroperoxidase/carboxymuconolactone decarboxylase family protein YurZ